MKFVERRSFKMTDSNVNVVKKNLILYRKLKNKKELKEEKTRNKQINIENFRTRKNSMRDNVKG